MNQTARAKLLLSEKDIELVRRAESMITKGVSDENILFHLFGVLTKAQELQQEDGYCKEYHSVASLAQQNLARRIRKTRWLRSIRESVD